MRVIKEDIREENDGRTTFASVGSNDVYKLFKWKVDQDGRIILAAAPSEAKMPE